MKIFRNYLNMSSEFLRREKGTTMKFGVSLALCALIMLGLGHVASAQYTPRLTFTTNLESDAGRIVQRVYAKKIDEYKKGNSGVSPIIELAQSDLNGDGQDEIIVRFIDEIPYCNENGACETFILAPTSRGWIEIGRFHAAGIDLARTSTKGVRDLVTAPDFSTDVRHFKIMKFNGKRYE